MKIKHSSIPSCEAALTTVNRIFNGNVKFKRLESKGNSILCTLSVVNSRLPGSRIGFAGKHVAAACWHVYGAFLDALLLESPDAVIETGHDGNGSKLKVTRFGGNWHDWNIGSMMNPLPYSSACDCQYDQKLLSTIGDLSEKAEALA